MLPFGRCNAPGVFTAASTRILLKCINVFALAYLDKYPREALDIDSPLLAQWVGMASFSILA